jgi:hypothetical protein
MKKNLPSVDGIKYAWNPRFYNKGWSMDETLKMHMLVDDAERNTDRWVMQKKVQPIKKQGNHRIHLLYWNQQKILP